MLAPMPLAEGLDADLLREAMATEAGAQRALLAGDDATARDRLLRASRLYRASWDAAGPASFGRLIGMLKAAVIADDDAAAAAATYARTEIPDDAGSPPARYAVAVAALVLGDDAGAEAAAAGMRAGSPAFVRAADAVIALARGDAAAYATAVRAIVADFEGRTAHLTGVAIADTALMLERLAEGRRIACRPASELLPLRSAG